MQLIRKLTGTALMVVATTLAQSALAQGTIKIGALNPYSGPLALYGTEVTRGYELAADKLNEIGRAHV